MLYEARPTGISLLALGLNDTRTAKTGEGIVYYGKPGGGVSHLDTHRISILCGRGDNREPG